MVRRECDRRARGTGVLPTILGATIVLLAELIDEKLATLRGRELRVPPPRELRATQDGWSPRRGQRFLPVVGAGAKSREIDGAPRGADQQLDVPAGIVSSMYVPLSSARDDGDVLGRNVARLDVRVPN